LKTNKKAILGIIAIVIAIAALVCLAILPKTAMAEDQAEDDNSTVFHPVFVREGYNSMLEWSKAVEKYAQTVVAKGNSISETYSKYFSDEEKEAIALIVRNAGYGSSFAHLNNYATELDDWQAKGEEYKVEAEKAAEEAAQAAAAVKTAKSNKSSSSTASSSSGSYESYSNGSGLTKSSGVNYYDGRKETYYSSKVLYHYRTSEWSVDSEGFYRTSDGSYVVAASDKSQGSTFEGSKGTCVVLDSGCAAGTTDYYVAW
jgi:hypothetical protein